MHIKSVSVYWSHRAFDFWINSNSDLRFGLNPFNWSDQSNCLITTPTQSSKKKKQPNNILDNGGLWFPPLQLNDEFTVPWKHLENLWFIVYGVADIWSLCHTSLWKCDTSAKVYFKHTQQVFDYNLIIGISKLKTLYWSYNDFLTAALISVCFCGQVPQNLIHSKRKIHQVLKNWFRGWISPEKRKKRWKIQQKKKKNVSDVNIRYFDTSVLRNIHIFRRNNVGMFFIYVLLFLRLYSCKDHV